MEVYEKMKETFTAICTAVITAGTPSGSSASVVIRIDPQLDGANVVSVPKDRVWKIVDLYVAGAPSVDCVVNIVKNGEEVVFSSSPLSTLLVSNPSRPKTETVEFKSSELLSMNVVTLESATSQASVTFFAVIEQKTAGEKGAGVVSAIARALGR